MNGTAVDITDLERKFGDFTAVDGISLQVPRGEIFGFLGPNGAGKTTTIRMLCGILKPTSGSGTVAGFDIRDQAEEIKKNIGYMSQKFSLYDDLTVGENIDFYSGIYRIPSEKKRSRKEWVLEMAGLAGRSGAVTGTLSVGWKQRLALGCAVLHEPPVLFLDEPTSGVDPISRRRFWELIYLLSSQGVTVFVTTHYMDEAEYCDRLGLIYRGRLAAAGTPAELKREHMAETVLEVTGGHPQELLDIVEEFPEIRYAAVFGRAVHLVTEDAETTTGRLRNLTGAGPLRVELAQPSLEDVFVSLIETADRAAPCGDAR
jgi:ABC-2 type transport system ATP-binding protein